MTNTPIQKIIDQPNDHELKLVTPEFAAKPIRGITEGMLRAHSLLAIITKFQED